MFQPFVRKVWRSSIGQIRNGIKKVLWQGMDLKWRLPSGLIVEVKCDADWVIYNDIFVNGDYDMPILQVIKSAPINRSLNLLDLGANVGFFVLRVVDLMLRNSKTNTDFQATLIEGSPRLHKELKSRLKKPIFSNRVRIIHSLVGERKGNAKIFEYYFHGFNSIFSNRPFGFGGVHVPYVDLFTLYNEDSEIDLLKCDIEGSEQRFLENYRDLLYRVRSAVFEFHYLKCDIPRCIDILKETGFINHRQIRKEPAMSIDYFWR